MVSGLAAAFGMSIYAVNLTEMNDRSLKAAINEVPENSVLLFEDIDCMQAGHRRGERNTNREEQAAGERDGVKNERRTDLASPSPACLMCWTAFMHRRTSSS